MKRLLILMIVIALVFGFAACSVFDPAPAEFTTGYNINSDLLPDEIPIPDDAVFYRVPTEDDRFNIVYFGSDMKLDKLLEYYTEAFEKHNITTEIESYSDDTVYIECEVDRCPISIKIEDTKTYHMPGEDGEIYNKYVPREYKSTLYISKTHRLEERLEGFWYLCAKGGLIVDIIDPIIAAQGIAFDFKDGKVTGYMDGNVIFENIPFEAIDNETIKFENENGEVITKIEEKSFFYLDENRDAIIVETVGDDGLFVKMTKNEMTEIYKGVRN